MPDKNQEGESEIDFGDFRDWVDRTADAQGTSDEAILEQLVSTYWILRELSETLEGTEYEDVFDPAEPEETDHPEPDMSDADLIDLIETIGEAQRSDADSTSDRLGGAVDPSLIQLVDTLQRQDQAADRPPQPPEDSPGMAAILDSLASIEANLETLTDDSAPGDSEALRELERHQESLKELTDERIDGLERRLEIVYQEVREAINAAAGTADTNTAEIEELRTDVSDLRADFEHEVRRLDGDLTELDEEVSSGQAGQADVQRDLERLEGRFEAHASETTDRIEELLDTLRTNMADVEEHLETLYESIGDQERHRDELVDVVDARLTDLLAAHQERQELQRLIATAHEDGIQTASCASCRESVDLRLLNRPVCPHCDRRFADIETERSLWRKRHTLRTRSPAYEVTTPDVGEVLDEDEATTTDAGGSEDGDSAGARADLDLSSTDDTSLNWLRR